MPKTKKTPYISRRRFIDVSLSGTVALGASSSLVSSLLSTGCGSPAKTVHGACYHDCPDTCSWITTTENGRVIKFEADENHPYTRGNLCAKMEAFPWDVTYNSDRSLYPLRRVGKKGEGEFERVSWEEALREVSERLKRIIDEDGPTAVLPYSFAGSQGLIQFNSISGRFFARLGASRLERNICGGAAYAGVVSTLGTGTGMLPDDMAHSRYIIIWGTNPVVTNPHQWPFMEEAREKGARIVVIDPRRSQTAQRADWHIQPLPGTDAALALGMMHVIIKEGLYDSEYVEKYTTGFDPLSRRVEGYHPQRVSEITGVESDTIVQLAREYAGTRPPSIRTLIGMEHHANGSSSFRAVSCLPALVGAWRERGGGLLNLTVDLFGACLNYEEFDILKRIEDTSIRSINMVQIGRALTNENLQPPIRALVVYNSNPAVIAPNQNLVWKGLAREDLLTVVLEHFITDTARFADYVFPATTQLEHWDLMDSWGQNYLSLNQPAIAPLGESKPNTEFFRLLSKEMDLEDAYLYETDEEMIRKILNSDHPYLRDVSLEQLSRDGWAPLNVEEPYLPFARGNFPTPSGKCEFYSETLAASGHDPLPGYKPIDEGNDQGSAFPLTLISSKSAGYFLNSCHANQDRQLELEGEPFLDMHALDAGERNIADGDWVVVFNQRGKVTVRVRVQDRIRPKVVSIPHGWWPSLMKGGSSANALTPDGLTDRGGGSDFHDAKVDVVKMT